MLNAKYIIVLSTILIFLNMANYVPLRLTFMPSYFIYVAMIVLLMVYYRYNRLRFSMKNMVNVWLIFYVLLCTVYFSFSEIGSKEVALYIDVVMLVVWFIFLQMYLNMDDRDLTQTRTTMIYVAVIASLAVVFEFVVSPGFFVDILHANIFYEKGRASAFYLNANVAGGAINILLIFTIDLIKSKYKIPYIFLLFLGLVGTMSRSNIMIFILLLVMMYFQKKINKRTSLVIFYSIFALFTFLATGGLDLIETLFGVHYDSEIINRINFFADSSNSVSDGSLSERELVLRAAIDMFLENPIVGNGFGAVRGGIWQHAVSPHNTFVLNWANYGILGMFIIPFFMYASTRNVYRFDSKEHRQLATLFLIYYPISCFFSHNGLDLAISVAPLVAISVMGARAKLDYKRRMFDA